MNKWGMTFLLATAFISIGLKADTISQFFACPELSGSNIYYSSKISGAVPRGWTAQSGSAQNENPEIVDSGRNAGKLSCRYTAANGAGWKIQASLYRSAYARYTYEQCVVANEGGKAGHRCTKEKKVRPLPLKVPPSCQKKCSSEKMREKKKDCIMNCVKK